jgi:hypothetical protein
LSGAIRLSSTGGIRVLLTRRDVKSILPRKVSLTDTDGVKHVTTMSDTNDRYVAIVPSPDVRDDSARIHRASQDRAFPAKREAAVAAICAAISDTWSRQSAAGKSAVNLQRNRYGWECYINLRFLTVEGTLPEGDLWADDDDVRIARFYGPGEERGPEPGAISYLDVHEDAGSLDEPMMVLRERALPWLDAHHGGRPDHRDFLPEA